MVEENEKKYSEIVSNLNDFQRDILALEHLIRTNTLAQEKSWDEVHKKFAEGANSTEAFPAAVVMMQGLQTNAYLAAGYAQIVLSIFQVFLAKTQKGEIKDTVPESFRSALTTLGVEAKKQFDFLSSERLKHNNKMNSVDLNALLNGIWLSQRLTELCWIMVKDLPFVQALEAFRDIDGVEQKPEVGVS